MNKSLGKVLPEKISLQVLRNEAYEAEKNGPNTSFETKPTMKDLSHDKMNVAILKQWNFTTGVLIHYCS